MKFPGYTPPVLVTDMHTSVCCVSAGQAGQRVDWGLGFKAPGSRTLALPLTGSVTLGKYITLFDKQSHRGINNHSEGEVGNHPKEKCSLPAR